MERSREYVKMVTIRINWDNIVHQLSMIEGNIDEEYETDEEAEYCYRINDMLLNILDPLEDYSALLVTNAWNI